MKDLPQLPSGDGSQDVAPVDRRGRGYPSRPRYADAYESDFADDAMGGNLLDYWQILRRRKGTLILFTVLGALIGLLISLPQTPIYQARASIEIQSLNENFMNMRDVSPTTSGAGYYRQADIETHVQILQSDSLVKRVVDKLNLGEKPQATYGTGRIAAWRKALGLSPPTWESAHERALAMAAGDLNVRALKDTRIVEVRVNSTDPRLAAAFANTLADEYVQQSRELRWESAQQTGDWLGRQLGGLRVKLEKSEEKLLRYARESGLMFTSDENSVAEERLRQLQAELSQVQADRIGKQSRYEMASAIRAESLPEILDASNLAQYEMNLTGLRRQLADLESAYTPAHPNVKRVQAQIEELETTIGRESKKILERVQNEYETALRREKLLASDYANQSRLVSDQSENSIQYNIFKKEVEANRQLHDGLLQKVKEAGVASAMTASNIRLVDPASPSASPYKPNHFLNSAMGLLAGVFLGVVFVLVREHVDRTLKRPGDTPFYLKAPELGVIPASAADSASAAPKRRKKVLLKVRLGNGSRRHKAASNERSLQPAKEALLNSVELATLERGPSLQAECFRATLTSILFAGQNGARPRVIVITSPLPKEGKTTVVSNIAIALAEINRPVLVIDADMRKPRMHEIFDIPNTWGLSDLLTSKNSLNGCPREALARETEIPDLYVLPSGPRTRSISNLLHSPRTPELLERVRNEFDTVLIDTPPMLQLADARVLGQVADAVILVVRAGQTTRDAAKTAAARFDEDGTLVLGTILNAWNPSAGGYGYYDDYYAYQKYYSKTDRTVDG